MGMKASGPGVNIGMPDRAPGVQVVKGAHASSHAQMPTVQRARGREGEGDGDGDGEGGGEGRGKGYRRCGSPIPDGLAAEMVAADLATGEEALQHRRPE
jgi:hypothetical protein